MMIWELVIAKKILLGRNSMILRIRNSTKTKKKTQKAIQIQKKKMVHQMPNTTIITIQKNLRMMVLIQSGVMTPTLPTNKI